MEIIVDCWFGANTVHVFKCHLMLKSCLALGLIMIAIYMSVNCKGQTFPGTGLQLSYYTTVRLGSKHTAILKTVGMGQDLLCIWDHRQFACSYSHLEARKT